MSLLIGHSVRWVVIRSDSILTNEKKMEPIKCTTDARTKVRNAVAVLSDLCAIKSKKKQTFNCVSTRNRFRKVFYAKPECCCSLSRWSCLPFRLHYSNRLKIRWNTITWFRLQYILSLVRYDLEGHHIFVSFFYVLFAGEKSYRHWT